MLKGYVLARLQIALTFVALALAGCTSTPPLTSGEGLRVVAASELPPPQRIDQTSLDRPYLLGPFDEIVVDVFGVEELSKREVQADASGRISFPLIGEVEAAGKSPGELARAMEERLIRYVKNPQVTVNLTKTVSQVVTVDGSVKEPGLYPVVGRMTLMRAIAIAKGATEFAKLDDVVVFRQVNNQKMAALYNVAAIRRGIYADPEIYANDIVVVGDSPARRAFRDLIQVSPALMAPLIAILDNDNN